MSSVFTTRSRPRPPALCVGQRAMPFGDRCYVMGVVNVTPDSFSDGGKFFDTSAAIAHARELIAAGADIIDIGGESTRPGADPVSASEEIDRILPVIEALGDDCQAWISVDTYKAEVAGAAADAGAQLINDVSGLGLDAHMADTVARSGCALILMHMRKTPKTMQQDIDYDDLIGDIRAYFEHRLQRAQEAGIDSEKIILDPGIGFGKTVDQNYRLLRELATFADLGHPLLVGTSRKSFIGQTTGQPAEKRLWGTAATVAASIMTGADMVRVHDVEELTDVVRVAEAVCNMSGPG